MTLILNGLPPLHWALAGLGIAGVTLALLLIGSRRLGISTGFEDVCSLVLPAPYFRRPAVVMRVFQRVHLVDRLAHAAQCTTGRGERNLRIDELPSGGRAYRCCGRR